MVLHHHTKVRWVFDTRCSCCSDMGSQAPSSCSTKNTHHHSTRRSRRWTYFLIGLQKKQEGRKEGKGRKKVSELRKKTSKNTPKIKKKYKTTTTTTTTTTTSLQSQRKKKSNTHMLSSRCSDHQHTFHDTLDLLNLTSNQVDKGKQSRRPAYVKEVGGGEARRATAWDQHHIAWSPMSIGHNTCWTTMDMVHALCRMSAATCSRDVIFLSRSSLSRCLSLGCCWAVRVRGGVCCERSSSSAGRTIACTQVVDQVVDLAVDQVVDQVVDLVVLRRRLSSWSKRPPRDLRLLQYTAHPGASRQALRHGPH